MEQLFQLLKESTSPCHTVLAAEGRLLAKGFCPLFMTDTWELKQEAAQRSNHTANQAS